MLRVLVALWCVVSAACSGYWYETSSSTARQRVGEPAIQEQFELEYGGISDAGFEVGLRPRCSQTWGVSTATVHQERFRSSTKAGLWAGLGLITAASGGIVMIDDEKRPLGALLLTVGAGELVYALVGALASTRRRSHTTTGTDLETEDAACPADLYVPARWTFSPPWGGTYTADWAHRSGALVALQFTPPSYCETNAGCRQLFTGTYVIRDAVTGGSWT